ncbi:MAG: hypothetical protein NVSMB63_17590 [Sediminibacterium sp.]
MKQLLIVVLLSSFLCNSNAQNGNKSFPVSYDSALAKRLGADEYSMKQYVLAYLKTGPTKIDDSAKRTKIQNAHLKNIFRLAN